MLIFNRILIALLTLSLIYVVSIKHNQKKKINEVTLKSLSYLPPQETAICFPNEVLENFGEGILGLKSQRYQREIESEFEYLGANTRPDQQKKQHFFKWRGAKHSLLEGNSIPFERLGLGDSAQLKGLVFHLEDHCSHTQMTILNQKEVVLSLHFEPPKQKVGVQIGGYPFDKNLLIRQKTQWVGPDLFLKLYGGSDYPEAAFTHRIDFHHLKEPYSCLVQENDVLVFKDQRWQKAEGQTDACPILRIEKIEEKQLHATIWDIGGRHFEKYLVHRTHPKAIPKNLVPLKFVGAKTKNKWLIQNNKERISLEKGDWLIHQASGWKKINNLETLEEYIQKINFGELFIVNNFEQIDGKKHLVGDLFNAGRTEMHIYHLSLEPDQHKK